MQHYLRTIESTMQFSRALLAKPSRCAIVNIFVSPDPTSPTAKYEVKLYHQMTMCAYVEGCHVHAHVVLEVSRTNVLNPSQTIKLATVLPINLTRQ